MTDFTDYLWIIRLIALFGAFILANHAARVLATLLGRYPAGPQGAWSPAEQLVLVGFHYLAATLCFAALATDTTGVDSWLDWLWRVAATAPYLTLLVALLVAVLLLIHLLRTRSPRHRRHQRAHRGSRPARPADWHGSAINPATGLTMVGVLDVAGNAYGTGADSSSSDVHSDSGAFRDDDHAGGSDWHSFDTPDSSTHEPSFDSATFASNDDSWRGTDPFEHDFSPGDSMTSSISHASDDDWSNAWGTAADHQIPAESNFDDPTHDYTSTTYGNDSSSDHDSSSSSRWD